MDTIPHLVLANAQRLRDEPALLRRAGREWHTTTWGEYGSLVQRAAKALIAAGIQKGDRVAILSYNTPEWVVFDVAAMAVGAVPVGIYFGSSPDQIADLIERSAARIVLAQTAAHIDKIDMQRHARLGLVVGVDAAPEGTRSWEEFLAGGDVDLDRELDERLGTLGPADPAAIIFTAAGHGNAVGVVLTHDNLYFAGESSIELSGAAQPDSVLSYLPLSHIAEQIFTIIAPAHVGYRVAFAQSIGRIRVDLPEIRPTIFFGVPLVWNGFAAAARKQVAALDGIQRRIAEWSMTVTRRSVARSDAGRRPGMFGGVAARIAQRLFTERARAAMGFDRTTTAYSGAASADSEMLQFFAGLGLSIRQVWGLSEATGPTAVTRRGAERHGTVGLPMPGVEIALADDGEVLVRGRSVFAGYLDDPAATSEALRDGWLHTGDIGMFDEDGLLTITGRKKDIVITSGGKNVCPLAIEALLEQDEAIVEAVVVGDGRDQLGVLIGVDGRAGLGAKERLAHAEQAVASVNERFARAEQIRKVGLLSRRLSVETGERSETGGLRRSVVIERFAGEIEDLYR
ncbi:MAG: AMP-dependent synthetase/ligase [Actinomycetota bacterium]